MTDYVNPPPPLASLPVSTGGQRFPIRRVFCVGRNYAAHAREMGKDPDRGVDHGIGWPHEEEGRCARDRRRGANAAGR